MDVMVLARGVREAATFIRNCASLGMGDMAGDVADVASVIQGQRAFAQSAKLHQQAISQAERHHQHEVETG
eukprot:COSAG01_NODE_41051_length_456_cov_1.313725_1_plen_70_part_01